MSLAPEIDLRYEELYARRAHLPSAESAPLRKQVAALAQEHGICDRRPAPLSPPTAPEQLSLLSA